jgi:16S rRNA G527 N7-methylase RsmG
VHVVLIDALDKRVKFLQSVIDELHLNAEAVHARAEDAGKRADLREQFDIATARAVAAANLLAEYLLPFVKVGGYMMSLKGPGLDEEAAEAETKEAKAEEVLAEAEAAALKKSRLKKALTIFAIILALFVIAGIIYFFTIGTTNDSSQTVNTDGTYQYNDIDELIEEMQE